MVAVTASLGGLLMGEPEAADAGQLLQQLAQAQQRAERAEEYIELLMRLRNESAKDRAEACHRAEQAEQDLAAGKDRRIRD